jgi:predicted dehydrogenase
VAQTRNIAINTFILNQLGETSAVLQLSKNLPGDRLSGQDEAMNAGPSQTPPSNPAGNTFSRRRFLGIASTAGIAAPFLVSCATTKQPLARGRRDFASGEKLSHACIGVGGMGWHDLHNFKSHPDVRIVAICDVDRKALERAAAAVPEARVYVDWRELLEKEDRLVNSVNVAVPDHMHFPIAWTAITKGMHVYLQKPMCHDVAEVRELARAAARHDVVTQLGTQVASSIHERAAVAMVKQGRIGKITRAYLCSNRPGAVEQYRLPGPRPAQGVPPPEHLNWDLWIGTAPMRPYAPDIYHPAKWRAWQDFGTGWSGDIGCHIFDPVWKGLGLQPALTVQAEVQESWKNSPARRGDAWPQGDHITWTFPANDRVAGNELVLEWFDGEFYPPENIRKLYSPDLKDYPSESAMLLGTEGAIIIPHGFPPQLLPEEKFQNVKLPTFEPRNHYHHFADACLGKGETESHFIQTGPMTEAILLGTVAIRVPNEKLNWDHKALSFRNHQQANSLLRRRYRDGWRTGGF